jgi:hypothetical protein
MRSRLATLLIVVVSLTLAGACKKPPPPSAEVDQPAQSAQSAAPVATQPQVIILLDAAPSSSPQDATAIALVQKWSAAHQKGDAAALQALFAPKVLVNGTTVTAADHVKKSLHQDADLRFSVGEVHAETTPDGKETFAHFSKRLTEVKGDTTKEYPKVIIVRDGVIAEDSDDPADWCINKDKTTNTKMHPGFKLSATSAVAAAKDSKHFAELKKRIPHLGSDLFGFGCAKRCAVPRRECGYHFRLSDMEDSTKIIEWVYVDPVTKMLWWQEKDWMSEQLR